MLILRKTIICKIFMIFLLLIPATTFASDFDFPHKFKPGDVISADVMNEVFDYIKNSSKTLSVSDLVGRWNCTKCKTFSSFPSIIPPDYEVDESGLFIYLEDITLEITENGDGSYSWHSPSRNVFAGPYCYEYTTYRYKTVSDPNENMSDPNGTMSDPNDTASDPNGVNPVYTVRCTDECAGSGIIASKFGNFAVSTNNCLFDIGIGGPSVHNISINITTISDTRIKIYSSSVNIDLLCDRINIPPNPPTDLSATASGLAVILSWIDNSDNETSFKIIRKENLEDVWKEIATTSANITSYEDTLSEVGTYWYRIKATNANGDSLGSNVIKVTLSE